MNGVKRYACTAINGGGVKIIDSQNGHLVMHEDYEALQHQLTATTNSLTNAQEALKSAGIEADTVQAGVMELKAQRDALAAENSALKGFGDKLNDMHNKLNGEGTGIQGRAEVACQQVALEAAMDEFDTIKIPATDAYLNAVWAEGADTAAAKIRKAIPAFKDIHCGAVKECADIAEMVAAQFTTGNAGKDGSHE
ncbi:hypothetical protein [Pantoea dispersa]|uniref:hypothetical protein n=1 Tax=Pantoea dispersa TaxID=59814 RepID=UPI0021AD7D22|nr:hypothetical protein [Pantoea dispersa]